MWKQLMDEPEGYNKDYQPGFKFRGLNDSTIFMDDNHQRLTMNYRNSYMRLALKYLYNKKDYKKVIAVLDKMEEKMPSKLIPLDYRLQHNFANIYYEAGDIDKYNSMIKNVELVALQKFNANPMKEVKNQDGAFYILQNIYDRQGQPGKFIDILNRLKALVPNDPNLDRLIQQYKQKTNKNSVTIPEQNK
jgi:tetratricopeptide (TPR) repeat protein